MTADSPPRVAPEPEVAILLALYRSEAFLPEQLASYAAQSHRNWRLIASDDTPDGPFPPSRAALDALRLAVPERPVELRAGPGQGFAANFLSLLQAVPPDLPYAALSDHDDVWFSDRLARGVAALAAAGAEAPGVPLLYCARTEICDADLTPRGPSPEFHRPPDFRNALVQSIGGGNTMMLNRAALDLAAAAAEEARAAGGPVVHDWWLYQIITGCGGRVIRDNQPVLFYRQHSGNIIGANRSLPARLFRFATVLGGRFRRWNAQNQVTLAASAHRFTPAARAVLADFAAARRGWPLARLHALRASGVYRQGRLGTLALYLACLGGRM